MRVNSNGIPIKKVMLTYVFPRSPLGKPGDTTFAASTWLAYFLREKLELLPPIKPPAMVFVLEHRVLSTIFVGKTKGIRMKELSPKLVLIESHGGRHCTSKKVNVCMVSLQG